MFPRKDNRFSDEKDQVKVLEETLEVARRNLSLTRMSLEYIEKLKLEAETRIEVLKRTIDRIEGVLERKSR